MDTSHHPPHDEKVARVAAAVRARAAAKGAGNGGAADEFASLGKSAVSHFVPDPHDPRHADKKIDVRDLCELLELDASGRTCTAEPGLTFSELVRATLAVGLLPTLVPELKTITVGGAVSGCSVESMSYKYGGFHDGCLEYEIVTGTGDVLRCSPDENPDVFDMIHGSYGTLGIITKLKFKLIPAKPYVRLEYRLHDSFEKFEAEMRARVAGDGAVDFIDAIVHAPDKLVLCLGRFAEWAPKTSDYTYLDVFFESTLHKREDFLTTYDYLFRYDTEAHWLTRTLPLMTTRPARLLLGKFLLGSTNLLRWSARLRPILKLQKNPPVVVDLFIPSPRFGEFFKWYAKEMDYWPLWIVPYRVPTPAYGWVASEWPAAHVPDSLFFDCAIYGKRNDTPGVDYNQVLEEKTYELGGIKTLISKNGYDEKKFWTVYNRDNYDRVKRRTDPLNLFRGLYEKFHYERGRALR